MLPNVGWEQLDRLLSGTDDWNTEPKRDWTQPPNHRSHLTHAQWTCQTGFQYGRHPGNPSTFLAQRWCSAAKGGLGKGGVPCLKPLHLPPSWLHPIPAHPKGSTETNFVQKKVGQTVVGYISLHHRKWRNLSKLWGSFTLTYNCLSFGLSYRMVQDYWGESQHQ